MSSARDHVTPHILTRKTRLRLRNFVIKDPKRLLQHYRPKADILIARANVLKNLAFILSNAIGPASVNAR